MAEALAQPQEPTRARKIIAAIAALVIVLVVWKTIDYRTQPPPPPHPVGERQPSR